MKRKPITEIIAEVLFAAHDWLTMREIADRIDLATGATRRPKIDAIAAALANLEGAGRVAVVRKRRPFLFCAGTTDNCHPYMIQVPRYPPVTPDPSTWVSTEEL